MSQPILQTIDGVNIYYSERDTKAWLIINNKIEYFYARCNLLYCFGISVDYLDFEMFENGSIKLIKKILALLDGNYHIENGNIFTDTAISLKVADNWFKTKEN